MADEPREARWRELLEHLTRSEVRFVLVGGLAVVSWGYIRGTRDVDVVPDPDPENLDRLAGVLEDLDGRVKVGERMLEASAIRTFLKAGDKALVVTRLGELDVLQGLPQIPRFEDLASRAVDADLAGIAVKVCSLDDLVAMKRAAGRPIDRIDLEALEIAYSEPGADEL